jgi:hypothetical protein
MAKDDLLYNALFGITPPAPTLSKILGLEPPPAPTIPTLQTDVLSALIGAPRFAPVPAPTGIRFKDSFFSEPKAFGSGWLPMRSGVYAILVIDGGWNPRPYRPLYFGKAGDLAARVVRSHEKYNEWCREAGGSEKLYVAYHLSPNAEWERAEIEESLIRHYSPVCNQTFNRFASLADLYRMPGSR